MLRVEGEVQWAMLECLQVLARVLKTVEPLIKEAVEEELDKRVKL